MRLLLSLIGVLIGLFLLPLPECHAWNATGHMASGQLAYRRLSPEARQQVAALLRQHPHFDRLLINDLPAGVDADEWAFMKCAFWPDLVRPASREFPTYKPRQVTDYHRGPWHFVNVPYRVTNQATTGPTTATATTEPSGASAAATRPTAGQPPAYPEPVHDVIAAIDWNVAILADTKRPAGDRAVALAWLCHLVGDIHQPLHACTLYSDEYPNGDRGGNDQTLRVDGDPINLHAYWDQALGTPDDHVALSFLSDDIGRDPRCDVAQMPGYGTRNSAKEWADESHALAIGLVYLNGRLKTVKTDDWRERRVTVDQVPHAPTSYAPNAHALARVRIALASARLADAIAAALKASPTP